MKLKTMKAIAAARTPGEWQKREDYDYYQGGTYLGVGPYKYDHTIETGRKVSCSIEEVSYFETDICRVQSGSNDLEFIAMAANNWDKLMAVVEAAKKQLEYLPARYVNLEKAIEDLEAE